MCFIWLVFLTFKYRLPSNTTYFRYIDDIFIFLPQNVKIEEIGEKLRNVEPFYETRYAKTPFTQTLPNFFSYQLPKIYLYFQIKKYLMKPDTFDFKSFLAVLLHQHPLHHLIISPHML